METVWLDSATDFAYINEGSKVVSQGQTDNENDHQSNYRSAHMWKLSWSWVGILD